MSTTIKAAVVEDGKSPLLQEFELDPALQDELSVKVVSHLLRVTAPELIVLRSSEMISVDGVGYVGGFEELVYLTSFNPGAGSYCRYVNVHMNKIIFNGSLNK